MKDMSLPHYVIAKKHLKRIPDQLISDVEGEIKAILHACRDCLRNQDKDTIRISWEVNNGYYGEAFGIMRALHMLGYGYYGAGNLTAKEEDPPQIYNITQNEQNLNWWRHRLEQEVLDEEGFDGDHRCEYCLKKYKKDDKFILEKKAQYDADQRARERGDARPDGDA